MKKPVIGLAALLAVVVLAGCGSSEVVETSDAPEGTYQKAEEAPNAAARGRTRTDGESTAKGD